MPAYVIGAGALDQVKAYEIEVTVEDTFGGSAQIVLVGTALCYMDQLPGQSKLGLFGYVPQDKPEKSAYLPADAHLYLGEDDLRCAPCGNSQAAVDGRYKDCNALWRSGCYDITEGVNTPDNTSSWVWLINAGHRSDTEGIRYGMQLAGVNGTEAFYARNRDANGAGVWRALLHTGNMNVVRALLLEQNHNYRYWLDNLDTTGQRSGFWLTTGDTAGTWPATVSAKWGILVSYNTSTTLTEGYRVQIYRAITDPAKFWVRHRFDQQWWTAWYRYGGTIDA